MKKKFVVSYSCGKDSTLSLYRMIKAGHTPVALLVTVDKKVLRSWFHGIPDKLLKDVSKSLDIPLVLVASNGKENYGETFVEALKKIKEEAGIENIRTVATGGYGRLIAENTDSIQIYDSELTLKGLQLIYAKNR